MLDKLPPKILVIEQDETVRGSICNSIERYWFNVIRASGIDDAKRLMAVNNPHVVIMGSNAENVTIEAACIQIRGIQSASSMPLIVLMQDSESADDYKNLGSDLVEYLPKPADAVDILRAIKHLLKNSNPVFQDRVIRYKDISMDLSTYKVFRKDRRINIGPTEFKLLQLLMESPKVIFSRQQLIDYVWGTKDKIEYRTVDVHVNRIRSMIRENKKEVPFIKTIRSAGYCMNLPGELD